MVLFQFGNLVFDNYIKYDGLDPTPNARQDLDSYRDADGVLQRNALQHTASSIEFTTRVMWDYEFEAMVKAMVSSYQNYAERDAICTYYDFENMEQKTGHFYLACEKLNVDRDGLNKMCPEDYYMDFITWLSKVKHT